MDTKSNARASERAQAEPDRIDYDDFASYEEGDALVVCDRENPNAWIKSDVTAERAR